MRTKVYCDASINGLSSVINICIERIDEKGNKKRESKQRDIQVKDITLGEFYAVYWGYKYADYNSIIYSDSINIVEMINKQRTIPEYLKDLILELRKLLKIKECELKWIDRDKNLAGICLEDRLNTLKKERSLKRFGIYDIKKMMENIK